MLNDLARMVPVDPTKIYTTVFGPPQGKRWKPAARMRDWRGRLWVLHPTKGWRRG